jgi:hypothetical protein
MLLREPMIQVNSRTDKYHSFLTADLATFVSEKKEAGGTLLQLPLLLGSCTSLLQTNEVYDE